MSEDGFTSQSPEAKYEHFDDSDFPGDPKNWKWDKESQQWDFIDDETLDSEVRQTLEDLNLVTRGILEKVISDRTYEPNLDEAKAIVSLIALESATEGNWNASLNACKPVVNFLHNEFDLESMKNDSPGETPNYWQTIANESMEDDANSVILYRELMKTGFFERLNLETSDKLALFMAEHLSDYEPAVIQEFTESGAYTFPYILIHKIHMSSEAQAAVAKQAIEYADKVASDSSKYKPWESAYFYYLDEFGKWGRQRLLSPTEIDMNDKDFKANIYGYVRENGLPRTLNMLRADLEDPQKEAKAREIMMFMLGDLKNKTDGKAVVDKNIDEFYEATFIEPGEYILNRESKEYRVDMVASTLRRHGVHEGSSVSEFASGTGWLAGGLDMAGFEVHAFDRNQSMLDIALSDYPNIEFQKFNWNRWQDWNEIVDRLGEGSQNAIVINGRSERHLEYPFESMSQISKLLQDGGIYMSDSPDVELKGSPQAQKLENNKQFQEQLGFFRPWLDKYFWHMVGTPPGQGGQYDHYIESWTPSRELKILYAEANGLEHLETIEEENYDGNGSRNLYMVFQRVERNKEREFKVEAFKRIDEYFGNQPKPHDFSGLQATYKD